MCGFVNGSGNGFGNGFGNGSGNGFGGFGGFGGLRHSGSSNPSVGPSSTYGEDQGSIGSDDDLEERGWDLKFLASVGAQGPRTKYDKDEMELTNYSRYLFKQKLTQGDLNKIRKKILKGQRVTKLIEKIENSNCTHTQLKKVPTLLRVIDVLLKDRDVFKKFMNFFANSTERFTSIIKGKEQCKRDLFNKQVEKMEEMISQLPSTSTGRFHPYNRL